MVTRIFTAESWLAESFFLEGFQIDTMVAPVDPVQSLEGRVIQKTRKVQFVGFLMVADRGKMPSRLGIQ